MPVERGKPKRRAGKGTTIPGGWDPYFTEPSLPSDWVERLGVPSEVVKRRQRIEVAIEEFRARLCEGCLESGVEYLESHRDDFAVLCAMLAAAGIEDKPTEVWLRMLGQLAGWTTTRKLKKDLESESAPKDQAERFMVEVNKRKQELQDTGS